MADDRIQFPIFVAPLCNVQNQLVEHTTFYSHKNQFKSMISSQTIRSQSLIWKLGGNDVFETGSLVREF